MAKLPVEILDAIELDSKVNEKKVSDGLLKRLFSRIVEAFKVEAGENPTENEGFDESSSDRPIESDTDNSLAYGYPPAYGVPAHLAVSLLSRVYNWLKNLVKNLDGDDKTVAEQLMIEISKALGISADGKSISGTIDPYSELRLAVTVSLVTQPVKDLKTAAEQLSCAWSSFADTVLNLANIKEGNFFETTFALRAAIECAVKSMLAAVANSEQSENDEGSSVDTVNEPMQSTEHDYSQSNEQKETNTVIEAQQMEQLNLADGNEIDETVSDNGSSDMHATSKTTVTDDVSDTDVLSILANMQEEIKTLNQRVNLIESLVRDRRRVTTFAASSVESNNNHSNEKADLLTRWASAKSESERRKILREAQSLLAKPSMLNDQ